MSPRRAATELQGDPRLQDLEYLRKGAGLTPARLAQRPAVMALLETGDPVDCAKRLDLELQQLSGDRRFAALRAAMGHGSGAPRLAERRRAFASQHNRSPDAVRDWEDEAIGELLLLLLGRNPQPPLPTPRFLIDFMKIDYFYVGRHFVRATHRRDLVVLAPEAGHFRYGLDEEIDLENVWGATASIDQRTPTGPIFRFRFPKTVARGGTQSFGWDEVRRPGTAPPPTEDLHDHASQIFHMPATRYELTATFSTEVPKRIWRFEQLAHAERPGRPEGQAKMTADSNGRVSTLFENSHSGLCSGIAWRW